MKKFISALMALTLLASTLPGVAFADETSVSVSDIAKDCVFSLDLSKLDEDETDYGIDFTLAGTNSKVEGSTTVSNLDGIGSFESENGAIVPYVAFKNSKKSKIQTKVTDTLSGTVEGGHDAVTVEFWVNFTENANQLSTKYGIVFELNAESGSVPCWIECIDKDRFRLKMQQGNLAGMFLNGETAKSILPGKWLHFVVTNYYNTSDKKYHSSGYINDVKLGDGTGEGSGIDRLNPIKKVTIGDVNGTNSTLSMKVAKFNVYNRQLTADEMLALYNADKANYEEKSVSVSSHKNGAKVQYPVIFSGQTVAKDKQTVKMQIDDADPVEATLADGKWSITVPEGEYGEKTVKFGLYEEDAKTPTYTEELSVDFSRPIALSDLDADISAGKAIAGSVKATETFGTVADKKIIAALFDGSKMLEYTEAAADGSKYGFSFKSTCDDTANAYVKVFAINDDFELLSNSLTKGAAEPAETAEALSEPTIGVNVSATQYEGENTFAISILASKKYANEGVIVVKDPDNNVDYINTAAVDKDGYGAVKYEMNTVKQDEAYAVYAYISGVNGKNSFKSFSQEKMQETLGAIEETASADFENDILKDKTHSEVLGLDMTNYNAVKDETERKKIIDEALAGKTFETVSAFKSSFNAISEEQAVLYKFETSTKDNYRTTLAGNNSLIGAKLDGLYTVTADFSEKLNTALKADTYYTYAALAAAVKENTALCTLENAAADKFVADKYIEKYYTELGISEADEKTYAAMEKKNRTKTIEMLKTSAIDGFADISEKFGECAAYVNNPDNAVYTPIMKLDLTNADEKAADTAKGIGFTAGSEMSVTKAKFAGTGKYQSKSGSKIKYIELDSDSQIQINMGKPAVKEATLAFWGNIDSTPILDNGNKRLQLFTLMTGKTQTLSSCYWMHTVVGKSMPINGQFAEKYTSGDTNFDAWNHYVFTYKWNDEGTKISYALYINGVRKNGDNNVARNIVNATDNFILTLGNYESYTSGNFKIGDITYYDEAIHENGVKTLYEKELAVYEPAAISLTNYESGDTAVYPFTLKGDVIAEKGQSFAISEDGVNYTAVDVTSGSWSYTFTKGTLGTRSIKFRIVNKDGTAAEELTVPMTFGYPLELTEATNISVKVTNRHFGENPQSVNGVVTATVYMDGKASSVVTKPLTAALSDGDSKTVTFDNILIPSTEGTHYVKYMIVDSVAGMNMLADAVYYPEGTTETAPEGAELAAEPNKITADVSYTPDTWGTVMTAVTAADCKNIVFSVYDKNNSLVCFGEAETDENGKAVIAFTPETVSTNETYTVKIKAGELTSEVTYRYNTSTAIGDTLLAVSKTSKDKFEQDILNNETHRYALSLDLQQYNSLDPAYRLNVCGAVAQKTYASAADFKTDFMAAVKEQTMLQALYKSSEATAEQLLNTYKTELGIDLDNAYNKLSSVYKKELANLSVCRKYYATAAEFKTAFNQNSMVSLFNFYQPIEIRDKGIIEAYQASFGLAAADVTVYNGYDKVQKLAVIDKMKLTGVSSYASLATVFHSSLTISTGGNSGNGGNGGNGGGGGGAGSTIVPSNTNNVPDPIDEEYAQAVAGSVFRDLRTDHWAYASIKNLVDLEVLNGVGNGCFDAEGKVTREQFVKMLLAALNIEPDASAAASFADVSSDAWYYSYIATAESLGIVSGVSDNAFGTGYNITRAEMCAMICRAVEQSLNRITASGAEKSFADSADIPQWAVEYVSTLSRAQIISGFEDGSFKANEITTRAMAAKVIDNLLKNFN